MKTLSALLTTKKLYPELESWDPCYVRPCLLLSPKKGLLKSVLIKPYLVPIWGGGRGGGQYRISYCKAQYAREAYYTPSWGNCRDTWDVNGYVLYRGLHCARNYTVWTGILKNSRSRYRDVKGRTCRCIALGLRRFRSSRLLYDEKITGRRMS